MPKRRCPFPEGPSHTQARPRGVVRHGFMHSRTGARTRLLCRTCGRTFCSRRGTAYYRLQRSRSMFDTFAAAFVEGASLASLSRTLRVAPATAARWLARAAQAARAFSAEHDRVAAAAELQFDELAARPAAEAASPWVFSAIEVGSRYWVAAVVGRRNRRTTREFTMAVRQTCWPGIGTALICSDPFEFYEREIRRTIGPGCAYVQVKNVYRRNCIVRSEAKVILGSQDHADALLEKSEDSKHMNTSFIERLNLVLRRSCSYLHRRTSGRVRNPARLAAAVDVVRCSYNFLRPHGRLRLGTQARTPAMQVGAARRRLSWRDVFGAVAIPQFPTSPGQPAGATQQPNPQSVHLPEMHVTPDSEMGGETAAFPMPRQGREEGVRWQAIKGTTVRSRSRSTTQRNVRRRSPASPRCAEASPEAVRPTGWTQRSADSPMIR